MIFFKLIKKLMMHPIYTMSRACSFLCNKNAFKQYRYSDIVRKPIRITPNCISLGECVHIEKNARIEGICKWNDKTFSPCIELEDNVTIQQNVHITCASRIHIGKNTAIAANVTITDINHLYGDVRIPVEKQDIEVKPVFIDENCKLYNGSVVLPGLRIGKHCVIGANSVVTHDIPDYCVVVGAPARVIKRYNFDSKLWEKTDPKGNFLGN